MSARTSTTRFLSAALVAGALLGAATTTAGAWPIPLTDVDNNFLNSARGAFPASDDQLLTMGRYGCRLLYTGSTVEDAVNNLAASNGASPDQARGVLNAATGTLCTQAPRR